MYTHVDDVYCVSRLDDRICTICEYVYICIYVYMLYVYMYTCIHVYMYMSIYVYTCRGDEHCFICT